MMNHKKQLSELLGELTRQAQKMGFYSDPNPDVDTKSWKDCPHLFFGFRVLTKGYPRIEEPDVIDGLFLDSYKDYMDDEEREFCTLVARRVDDMSLEELAEMLGSDTTPGDYAEGTLEEWRTGVIDRCRDGDIYRDDMLYLLSKRVYPFNPDHFDTGLVTTKEEGKSDNDDSLTPESIVAEYKGISAHQIAGRNQMLVDMIREYGKQLQTDE